LGKHVLIKQILHGLAMRFGSVPDGGPCRCVDIPGALIVASLYASLPQTWDQALSQCVPQEPSESRPERRRIGVVPVEG
jgi:hypothetical protein